ncbi:hypothetical protein BDV96DRAFT_583629 [Lophiotrema nucula]|uniref:Uncharacterized protein n=1 Tax=Lophiotrema nucula TaxID=690887 RepID=A0A6A5YUA3_9PLEO|nr:hypothetical protein BDV96DRAFT_583629 [Lophiotrema nucula]
MSLTRTKERCPEWASAMEAEKRERVHEESDALKKIKQKEAEAKKSKTTQIEPEPSRSLEDGPNSKSKGKQKLITETESEESDEEQELTGEGKRDFLGYQNLWVCWRCSFDVDQFDEEALAEIRNYAIATTSKSNQSHKRFGTWMNVELWLGGDATHSPARHERIAYINAFGNKSTKRSELCGPVCQTRSLVAALWPKTKILCAVPCTELYPILD